MIPGSVSRLVEGSALLAPTPANSYNLRNGEVFRIQGAVTVDNLFPPLGRAQNQIIWLVPTVAGASLTAAGNIATALAMAQNRAVQLIWLKSTQKWYVENGV